MSFITTTYNGREFTVPATGRDENLNDMLTDVPDDDHALAFLMQDGNLRVPGGRFGDDTASCAPIALAIDEAYGEASGEPRTYHGLDHAMSMVVNSSDDVYITLLQYCPDEIVREHLSDDDIMEGVRVLARSYDEETASETAARFDIVLPWRVVDIPIVETAERPRRVLFEGNREHAEGFYFEFIERDDVDEFYVGLELAPLDD